MISQSERDSWHRLDRPERKAELSAGSSDSQNNPVNTRDGTTPTRCTATHQHLWPAATLLEHVQLILPQLGSLSLRIPEICERERSDE